MSGNSVFQIVLYLLVLLALPVGLPWLAIPLPWGIVALWLRKVRTTCFDGGGVFALVFVIVLVGNAVAVGLRGLAQLVPPA